MSTTTIHKISTHWLGLTAIVVLLTGAVVGCSSGGEASSASSLAAPGRLTKQQLISAADQTCHTYAQRVEIMYNESRGWRRPLKTEQVDLRVTMDHLRKFRVDPAVADGWERFLSRFAAEQQARWAFVEARLSGGTPEQQQRPPVSSTSRRHMPTRSPLATDSTIVRSPSRLSTPGTTPATTTARLTGCATARQPRSTTYTSTPPAICRRSLARASPWFNS